MMLTSTYPVGRFSMVYISALEHIGSQTYYLFQLFRRDQPLEKAPWTYSTIAPAQQVYLKMYRDLYGVVHVDSGCETCELLREERESKQKEGPIYDTSL